MPAIEPGCLLDTTAAGLQVWKAQMWARVRHVHSELVFLKGEENIVREGRVTRAQLRDSVAVRDSLQSYGRVFSLTVGRRRHTCVTTIRGWGAHTLPMDGAECRNHAVAL